MVLTQQVRKVLDEENLLDTSGGYSSGDGDWTTKVTKSITLSEEKIVYVKLTGRASNSHGNVRVLLDGEPILATGYLDFDESQTVDTYLLLAAGSYTFKFQLAQISHGSGGETHLDLCYISTLNFSDVIGANAESGAVSVEGYNFIGVAQVDTGGHEAYDHVSSTGSPSPPFGSEFSDGEYDDIEYADGLDVSNWGAGEGEYAFHLFRFKCGVTPVNITKIVAVWIGKSPSSTVNLYIWDDNGSGWSLLDSGANGSDAVLSGSKSSNCDHYVNGSDYIYVMVRTDTTSANLDSDQAYLSVTTGETTVVEKTFTSPQNRALPVGSINKIPCFINVALWATNFRNNDLIDTGESNVNDRTNWKIYINGTQVDWDYEQEDTGVVDDEHSNYAEGSFGRAVVLLDPGTQYTVKVAADHLTGASTIEANVRIIACPWIIADSEYQPITLDIPDKSTLYIITEPLESDPTKNVKIGKQRFVSHGDSTDFYYTNSGTGILESSYTFETVKPNEVSLLISGYGGCISLIGVDLR